jgi:large subunit ribosomal protein L35
MANKQKTKKGAKKRFTVTKTGKILRRHGYTSHHKEIKSPSRLRRQAEPGKVEGKERTKIKRLIGK